jgi:hypothetical protein
MTIDISYRIFWSLNLLYCIEISFHHSPYSQIFGLSSFAILSTYYIFSKKIEKFLLLKFIEPMIFLILALSVARSTMTVAFFYISLNLMLASIYHKPLHFFFKPTVICIYIFAGLNKFSPGFRDGDILSQYLPQPFQPYSGSLAILAILTELSIAVLVYFNLFIAKYFTIALHLGILILIPTDLLHFYSLAIYGVAMIVSVNLSLNRK